jgi:hypothetical protein
LKKRYYECRIMPIRLPTSTFLEMNLAILKMKTCEGRALQVFCKNIDKLVEHVNLIIL